MNADNDFQIGKDHIICEDFSLSGTSSDRNFAYAIVCDGCSASKSVDIGARAIALSARESIFFSPFTDQYLFGEEIIKRAHESIDKFPLLHRECLDATLLMAYVHDNRLTAYMFGDGVLIHKTNLGIKTVHIHLTSGAPDYLSYILDKERIRTYDNLEDNKKIVVIDGVPKEYKPFEPFSIIDVPVETGDVIAIISDGINSFGKSDNTMIDWKELVDEFTGFKNFEGQFVLRRLAAFKRKCIKENWHHSDDISMAAIIV